MALLRSDILNKELIERVLQKVEVKEECSFDTFSFFIYKNNNDIPREPRMSPCRP